MVHKITIITNQDILDNRSNAYDFVNFDLNDEELTETCMEGSLSSFAEEWDKEDDNIWREY